MSGPRNRRGRVILVGAGPGDPDLVTLRGLAALRQADAVLYDELAAPQLLDHAPPGALRINVGKRGHDAPTRGQQDIEQLLVKLALEGRTVVRLKGGDPFVFGRGGEEASACAAAGVPFEVVPGVSSAIAAPAYAGIPVTDRRHAASFAVVTGHKDPTRVTRDTDWAGLAAADTLVILMGMRNLAGLVERIVAAGRDPQTPAAAVMDASLPSQRVVEAPLARLPERVREAGLGAPAAVVIGPVVTLRDTLAWFEPRAETASAAPLAGWRVLVTRSAEQAGALSAALRRAGAEPVEAPLIRLEPPADPAPLDEALDRLDRYDALLLTSANAVRFTADRAAGRGVALAGRRALCVGPRTAEAARAAGLEVEVVPAGRFDAEGLLAALREGPVPVAGRRLLLPRAEEAREVLPEGLRAAGARVDVVAAYRNVPAETDAQALRETLASGALHALTFTSPSTVRRFVAMLDAPARAAARACAVAAIGPVTGAALREAGLEPDAVAPGVGVEALVDALVRLRSRGGRPDAQPGEEPATPGGAGGGAER